MRDCPGLYPAPTKLSLSCLLTFFLVFSLPCTSNADNTEKITQLPTVVVTEAPDPLAKTKATLARKPSSSVLITNKEIQESRGFNLEDVFHLAPGVFFQSRTGGSEGKLSIRGTNLSSNFGFWGVTLLIDGLPMNAADGFTHLESIDLLAVDHIEVYKGAQAIRFGGNSIGGAVNFVLKKGVHASRLQMRGEAGSYGFYNTQISSGALTNPFSFGGQTATADYYVSVTGSGQDGFRINAQQAGVRLNANMGMHLGQHHRARMILISTNIDNELPGGLSRSQFENNPKQAGTSADLAANILVCTDAVPCGHKNINKLDRLGISYQYERVPGQKVTIAPFYQHWSWEHHFTQWFDQLTHDFGAEVRYDHTGSFSGITHRLIMGASPWYGENRLDVFINNFGIPGAILEKRFIQTVNLGGFLEEQVDVTPNFTVILGARLDYSARDAKKEIFSSPGTSSALRPTYRVFSAISPKIGFVYRATPTTQLYGNVSRGYEPPVNIQMMQALDANSMAPLGAFTNLDAQRAWQFELGHRGTTQNGDLAWEITVYDLEMRKEILVTELTIPGGEFPTWRNANATRHTGVEVGGQGVLKRWLFISPSSTKPDQLSAQMSYTWRRLKFLDNVTKVSGGAVVLDTIDGNTIPGIPEHWITGELRYDHPSGFWIAPNILWSPAKYFLDNNNLVTNPAFVVINMKGGWRLKNGWQLFMEGRNLADKNYAGSVIAGGANSSVVMNQRLFHPSWPLSVFAGLEIQLN